MTEIVEEVATWIIETHLLVGPRPGECLCGWGRETDTLGQRHSAHVAHELNAFGLLRDEL